VLPIGLGYIYSTMVGAGYKVECLNLNHHYGTAEEIINKKLNSKKFDFVCTGNNALGYAITERILTAAKNHPSKPRTILGGPIITSEPELIFGALKPSFGVLGEGEETITDLLKTIESKKDLKKVRGIIFRESDGKVIKTPPRLPPKDLNSIPFPNYDAFGIEEQLNHITTNYAYYANLSDNTRAYPILGSRSCPFQCTFCYHDSRYRKRSLDNVMKEINLAVKKYRINMLTIHDECFATDNERLKEFCKRMIKLKKEISWDLRWFCQLRVEAADESVLKMMKKAGCVIIGYGLESYSLPVLKSMKKYTTPEQIDAAIKKTFSAKIALQSFFIFGDTAETKETARETLEYWKNHCKGQVGLGFIQPYPGSEIYKRCVERRIIKDKLSFLKNLTIWNWFNMTDKMTDREVRDLKRKLLYMVGKYTKFQRPIRLKKMRDGNYEVIVKCPFCKETLCYKNCQIENRLSYGFSLICRKCFLRFFVVSPFQKFAYANYSWIRPIRDIQLKISGFLEKKRL
jgi:radical SAM superfamily enzyme YgiQ (UPF0313 family)